MTYLHHLTLTTGHTRRSERSEVADQVVNRLRPWLADLLASGERRLIPMPDDYLASATAQDGALLCTVWAPYQGEDAPLVTFGVAGRSRQAPDLWGLMVAQYGNPHGLPRPGVPWCAAALHPTLALRPQSWDWLGDFERCVAWVWLERP